VKVFKKYSDEVIFSERTTSSTNLMIKRNAQYPHDNVVTAVAYAAVTREI